MRRWHAHTAQECSLQLQGDFLQQKDFADQAEDAFGKRWQLQGTEMVFSLAKGRHSCWFWCTDEPPVIARILSCTFREGSFSLEEDKSKWVGNRRL